MISIETPQITLSSKRGWQKWKLAHAFNSIGSGTTPPTGSVEYFQGKIPWVNTGDLNDGYIYSVKKFVSEKAIVEFSALKIFPQNSLIIAMYGATIGKLGILKMDACTNQACCILAKPNHLDIKFVFYSLISDRNNIIELAQGGGQPNISQEIVKNLRVFAPNIATQKSIASFLDRKTAAIDTLIAKKQRLIQLLEEKRTALINQAVTKGLNSIAPMKDSGIPLIGEIPEHWDIVLVKRVAYVRYGLGQPPPEVKNGLPLIRATNIKSGSIFEQNMIYVDPDEVPKGRNATLAAGEIIVVRSGAYTGDSAIIPQKYEGAIAEYDMVVTIKKGSSQFIAWQLLSQHVRYFQFAINQLRAAQSHLNAEELNETILCFPPTEEQKQIILFLRAKTDQIEALGSKTKSSIEKLQEYRRSLITAAVTGKLEIGEVEPEC
jgi:type I restriction enzyme, S subunit